VLADLPQVDPPFTALSDLLRKRVPELFDGRFEARYVRFDQSLTCPVSFLAPSLYLARSSGSFLSFSGAD
jgi:hypothetical protein